MRLGEILGDDAVEQVGKVAERMARQADKLKRLEAQRKHDRKMNEKRRYGRTIRYKRED